jgi:hypothetical protein
MEVIHKIGRRKSAVARVYVSKGKGNITVNKRDISSYFPTSTLQYKINQPLAMTNNEKSFDITVNVFGGGASVKNSDRKKRVKNSSSRNDNPEFKDESHIDDSSNESNQNMPEDFGGIKTSYCCP